MRSKPEQRTTRLVTVTARKLRQTNSSPMVHPFLVDASLIASLLPHLIVAGSRIYAVALLQRAKSKWGLGLCFQWITLRQILTSQIHIAAALRLGPGSATQPLL